MFASRLIENPHLVPDLPAHLGSCAESGTARSQGTLPAVTLHTRNLGVFTRCILL